MPNRYSRILTPLIAFAALAALNFAFQSTALAQTPAPPPAVKHRVAVMNSTAFWSRNVAFATSCTSYLRIAGVS